MKIRFCKYCQSTNEYKEESVIENGMEIVYKTCVKCGAKEKVSSIPVYNWERK